MGKIDSPYYSIEYIPNGMESLRLIEACGRTSYKSTPKLVDEYNRLINPELGTIDQEALEQFTEKSNGIIEQLYNKFGRNYEDDYESQRTSLVDHLLDGVKNASALTFVKMIIENGHLSVLEFSFLVIRFYVNIGYTCEIIDTD